MNAIPCFAVCEATGKYQARRKLSAKQIINAAKKLLEQQVHKDIKLSGFGAVKDYLIVNYAKRKNEVFICLYLDSQLGLIEIDEAFTGTVDGAAVYPRVIVQRCLELNAASVVFAHNHPSGNEKASHADIRITLQLKEALNLVDVRVLDHIVIGGGKTHSLAASGVL